TSLLLLCGKRQTRQQKSRIQAGSQFASCRRENVPTNSAQTCFTIAERSPRKTGIEIIRELAGSYWLNTLEYRNNFKELRSDMARHLSHSAETRSDHELLDDFLRDHESEAFAHLVARHGPMILGVCRRILHHQADAEDAFQATFLTLLRKGHS